LFGSVWVFVQLAPEELLEEAPDELLELEEPSPPLEPLDASAPLDPATVPSVPPSPTVTSENPQMLAHPALNTATAAAAHADARIVTSLLAG
jgi:hypothetical protein